jgi:hypothetical protein
MHAGLDEVERAYVRDRQAVIDLCDRLGYGFVMDEASKAWQAHGVAGGYPTVGKLVGPHVGQTIRCRCLGEGDCDWCCGCGWVTSRVSEAQSPDLRLEHHSFD